MQRINVRNFKGAIIQYLCEECNMSDDFFVEFSDIPKIKPGGCSHYKINFLLVNENIEIKYLLSITCNKCKHNQMKELFNKDTKDMQGSFIYDCPKCKNGKLTAGFLLSNENIEFDNEGGNINKDIDKNKMINLIFKYEGQNYNVSIETNKLIPEAFYEMCEKTNNKELENLDIQNYKKGDDILSQFKSIEELHLKNGDVIDIQIRANVGW